MTRHEAKLAIESGKKVTHRYFDSKEWVTKSGFHYLFEDGNKILPHIFWKDREGEGWNDGWGLFND